MIIKTKELEGYESFLALQVWYKVMIGYKMFAPNAHFELEKFFEHLGDMDDAEKEKCVREALLITPLSKEDIELVSVFCSDANGVSFKQENMRKLSPSQVHDILAKVFMEITKIKINLLSEDEKKN